MEKRSKRGIAPRGHHDENDEAGATTHVYQEGAARTRLAPGDDSRPAGRTRRNETQPTLRERCTDGAVRGRACQNRRSDRSLPQPARTGRSRTRCALAGGASSHGNQAQSAALEWADTVTIEVDWPASSSAAIKAGVENWEAWQFERGNYDADGQSADAATKRRWARNYLRHCATTYEEQLAALFGVVGKDDAYQLIKLRVEEMIEQRFPDLAQ